MISVVSAKGALRSAIYEGSTNAAVFIDFCKRLLHDVPRPVYLIVDGHLAHRATATKEFAASTEGRLRLFFLPGYSAELNFDESVWKKVKHDRIDKAGPRVSKTSRPRPSAPCGGSRNARDSFRHSSPTRSCRYIIA